MPSLTMEFWGQPAILAIAAEVGKPLDVDIFIDHLRKIGYARVKVEIDSANPLSLRVLIEGKQSNFWQPFVYENLPPVCFCCG